MENFPEFTVMRYLMDPGDHVIDLGANMGFYTKYFSDCVGPTGIVYSIEPIPGTFDLLSSSVHKLGLANVHPINYAISNRTGLVEMGIPLLESGEENIFEAKIITNNDDNWLKKVTVKTTTIDEMFPSPDENITFIKCDVEGHEYECILSATKLISRSKPSWFIEIWGDLNKRDSAANKTKIFFEEYGYSAYMFDGKQLKRYRSGDEDINYFFLTPEHIARLQNQNTFSLNIS